MEPKRIERTHFFTGEALLTGDFVIEQTYNINMLRNHNRSLHTYGIARGLEVRHDPQWAANQIEVAPGTAIDRLGREIIQLEPQVLRIEAPVPGANYYLTITYDEVYADYTAESGVAGYKRIVQQPRLAYGLNLKDPGLHLLLAVIGFSSDAKLNNLTHKLGSFERRYVGSVLGTVAFVTEGSGVVLDAQTDAVAQLASNGMLSVGHQRETRGYASISARRETTALPGEVRDYLLVDAQRTQFAGLTTTRGSLGIGVDQPTANLQIEALSFKGPGSLSSDGRLVHLTAPLQPFFQPGDLLITDPSVRQVSQRRTITAVDAEHLQVWVDAAFNPPLTNVGYTFRRAHLASFASSDLGSLFEVRHDGHLGLGKQYAVASGTQSNGPSALVITPDRKVGIALTTTPPQAELEVNGNVMASSVTCAGKVVAGSFEGNGSKLVGLPILSFWTQETPGDPQSKLHYLPGNVGVRQSNPSASLGVGGGHSQIGSGLVSAVPGPNGAANLVTLKGYQTLFTKEISDGAAIMVGTVQEVHLTVNDITDATHLTTTTQPPFVLYESPYQILSSVPSSTPRPGNGTLNSNGTQIVGIGTNFKTDLQPGDQLIIAEFKPDADLEQSWYVDEVVNDTELTLRQPAGISATFEAKSSAYLITQALIAQFKGDKNDIPALQVLTSGSDKITTNTVTVNVPIEDVDPTYALQVNGNVNFSGGGGGVLSVQTLLATRNVQVQGDGRAALLLQVAEGNGTPILGVTKDNVVLGQAAGDAKYLLDAKGDLHTSGNLVADQTVTAGQLAGSSLAVSGSQIGSNGSVQFIGARTAYTQSDLYNNGTTYSATANTDGFVVATVGNPAANTAYFGYLEGMSQTANGTTTSYTYAAAVSYPITVGADKKNGGTTYYPALPGSFTLPVRAGETWTLILTSVLQPLGYPAPTVEFYWVPLGTVSGGAVPHAASLATSGPAAPGGTPAPSPMQASLAGLRAAIQSGQLGQPSEPNALEAVQRSIDERVNDAAKVFGDATQMSDRPEDRAALLQGLQKIVCRATPAGQDAHNDVDPQHLQSLIDTFARLTGRTFDAQQRVLLTQGLQGLIAINDSAASRQDLTLIKRNIDTFLDGLGQVLGKSYSSTERRPLTRALVRLVGDGGQPASGADGRSLQPLNVPLVPHEARRAATGSFLQELEQLLGRALPEAGKDGLRKIIDEVITQRPTADHATGQLASAVEAAAGDALTQAVRPALMGLIGKLLRVLL